MKLYNYQTADKLINDYIDKGGIAHQFNEGVLGSGHWVLSGLNNSFVILETFINSWSSGHKITKYKKLPKKYQSIFENEIVEN
jgi:hypothetical protein